MVAGGAEAKALLAPPSTNERHGKTEDYINRVKMNSDSSSYASINKILFTAISRKRR
jgi:hypothetical protein